MIYNKEKQAINGIVNNINIFEQIDSEIKCNLMFAIVQKYFRSPFDEKIKFNYSIDLLMFTIGYYGFHQFLDDFYANYELRDYYKFNVLHYCSLGAVFKNNQPTIDKLLKLENIGFDKATYEKILADDLKYPNNDVYKFCDKISKIQNSD